MPDLTNSQIATALDELGDLYELDGAIIHRVVAYRTAAKAVRESSTSVAALAPRAAITVATFRTATTAFPSSARLRTSQRMAP